jgi:hypothetical protein
MRIDREYDHIYDHPMDNKVDKRIFVLVDILHRDEMILIEQKFLHWEMPKINILILRI